MCMLVKWRKTNPSDLGKLQGEQSGSSTVTFHSSVPRFPPLQNEHKTTNYPLWTGTHGRTEKLTSSTTIMQLTFQKQDIHKKETQQQETDTAKDVRGNNTWKQWGSKSTNHSRPSCYMWWCMISRPHRLMKTSSNQSKRRDLHPKWLHRETNDNNLLSLYVITTMNSNKFIYKPPSCSSSECLRF